MNTKTTKIKAPRMGKQTALKQPRKKPPTAHLAPAWKPGQSGNPSGRPKGARSRLGERFLESLEALWKERGQEILDRTVAESPATIVQVVAKLLPRDVKFEVSGGAQFDLTIEQRKRIATAWLVSVSDQLEPPAIEAVAESLPALPKHSLESRGTRS